MGDDDRRDGPSLELPSWRLGRRRAQRDEAREAQDAVDNADPQAAPQPAPSAPPPEPAPEPEPEPTRPLFADEAPTTSAAPPPRQPEPTTPAGATAPAPGATTVTAAAPEPAAPAHSEPPRRTARRPHLGGMPAAVLTGLLVGVVAVALTWVSQRGCGALRGTSTCGGGPGLLLLVAIMVAMVFLGAGLLRLLGVSEPGSTSFLGVGLLAVITLLFLTDVIFDWWMAIVVPVCAALTFALSRWVTTTYVDIDG